MEDSVAHGAVRQLTVDIANLTGRLAILQATADWLQLVAARVHPEGWKKVMGEDAGGNPETQITLRGEQVDAIEQLLVALESLG